MSCTLAIDCFPSLREDDLGWTVVGIDVIRTTTTAVTAVAAGRRCFSIASLAEAAPLVARLENPLLVGELDGALPSGFHLQNSPAEIARPVALERPVILLSTSGTPMLAAAGRRSRTYVACLRNVTAQAGRLVAKHDRVLLLAATSRGEFREEDRLCCGRLGRLLLEAGYEPQDLFTEDLIKQWGDARDDAFLHSHSVQYLRATGQMHDVEFILDHVDDLDCTFELHAGEVVQTVPAKACTE